MQRDKGHVKRTTRQVAQKRLRSGVEHLNLAKAGGAQRIDHVFSGRERDLSLARTSSSKHCYAHLGTIDLYHEITLHPSR